MKSGRGEGVKSGRGEGVKSGRGEGEGGGEEERREAEWKEGILLVHQLTVFPPSLASADHMLLEYLESSSTSVFSTGGMVHGLPDLTTTTQHISTQQRAARNLSILHLYTNESNSCHETRIHVPVPIRDGQYIIISISNSIWF